MWNEILDENALNNFLESISFFHDSCIKELKYLSGAYVDNELAMYPINDRRILNVIIQRQFEQNSMIELEFQGLKKLKLYPADDTYTCEILDSIMFFKDDYIYWCDCGGLSVEELNEYEGTLVVASRLRWRSIEGCMGKKDFFLPIK